MNILKKLLNLIIRQLKYYWRNKFYIIFSILWIIMALFTVFDKNKATDVGYWSLFAIITTILVYLWQNSVEQEKEYGDVKKTIKFLHIEYKNNIEISAYLDQAKTQNINLKILSFTIFSKKFIGKVVERRMIKDKTLFLMVKDNLKRITWFNRAWLILAKSKLLGQTRMNNKIRDHLIYNYEQIYKKLIITEPKIKEYFEKEFNEELKDEI